MAAAVAGEDAATIAEPGAEATANDVVEDPPADIALPDTLLEAIMRSTASAPASLSGLVVPRPPAFGAWARKPRRGLSKLFGTQYWTSRFFKLFDGRLYWSDMPPTSNAEMRARHACIDFALTPCRVQTRKTSNTRLVVLSPLSGHVWSEHDRHNRRGTSDPLVLEVSGSGFASIQWRDQIRQHITFANVRPTPAKRLSTVLRPLTPEELQPCEGDEEDECCPICLEDIRAAKCGKPVESICGHRFHKKCCREWFVECGSCPVCRAQLIDMEAPGREPRPRAQTWRSVGNVLQD